MNLNDLPAGQLVEMAEKGNDEAWNELLVRYRSPLKKMIAIRLDARLRGRLDESDVAQETLKRASQRRNEYLANRPIEFLPWLRQIADNCMIDAYRQHIAAVCRDVGREFPMHRNADDSDARAIDADLDSITTPSQAVLRRELCEILEMALAALREVDREVIVLRYYKQLSTRETATALGVGEEAVKARLLRALRRLRQIVERRGYE